MFLKLEGLGCAFRYLGVAEDDGLGRPRVRRDRIGWGRRLVAVPPGTQVTLSVQVAVRRRGVYQVDSGERLSLRPRGVFPGRPGMATAGRLYRVAGPRRCGPYRVIGVRGSADPMVGPYGLGTTVGPIVDHLVRALPRRSASVLPLRYPAAPATDLLREGGDPFFLSMAIGRNALTRELASTAVTCPRTRVALVGYSQGAAVVGEAARALRR